MKKSSDIRGDLHRAEILKFIKNNSSKDWRGVEIKEIVKHTCLSRPTVTEHVSKLVAKNELRKTRRGRGTYLPAEIFDDIAYSGWGVYESLLNMLLEFFIKEETVLNLQNLANIVIALTDNPDQTMEKFIFEFANKIGPVIIYVLLECLRSRRNIRSEVVRAVLDQHMLLVLEDCCSVIQ